MAVVGANMATTGGGGERPRRRTARDVPGRRSSITFLETGTPPGGLFTPDIFCDFTMPQWRLQARGIEDVTALRQAGHPGPSAFPGPASTRPTTGFVLEIEEEWE